MGGNHHLIRCTFTVMSDDARIQLHNKAMLHLAFMMHIHLFLHLLVTGTWQSVQVEQTEKIPIDFFLSFFLKYPVSFLLWVILFISYILSICFIDILYVLFYVLYLIFMYINIKRSRYVHLFVVQFIISNRMHRFMVKK